MDYHNAGPFANAQSPQAPFFTTGPHAPSFPAQVAPSPGPPRLQQPGQHPYNGGGSLPMGPHMAAGNVPNGSGMMQPGFQQFGGQHPYSTGPQSQGISPTSIPGPQGHSIATSASSRHISPYANPQNNGSQPQTPVHTQTPQQRPMAAPAPPVHAQNGQVAAYPMKAPAPAPAPATPLSPGAQARERDRVILLLDINRVLLQEVLKLQQEGKTGPLPQPGQNPEEAGGKEGEPRASQEYIQAMRRLQANLAYLAATVDRNHKPQASVPQGPAIMEPLITCPPTVEMYSQLQKLFPGWKGQMMKVSPSPQAGNTSSSSQPS
ncbi:hypothetical protein EV356DRAFT_503320 [Viridothelium virens]|uniref:Uncharacterized protein n=1 Tax=Viridothelium virens TaxID=1048519 RepID=A0A6A6H7C6_VIRVR|nr:hypothetical protein EV356DRAFT_503320 [Viridothelium virens]